MYLIPPQPTNSEICISGDVEIHPSASIAPGVILQAAPQSRIVIEADVCLGMGVIISIERGAVKIERGAALGSGVLVIGASKIGNNACVGTATTIFKASVAAMAVIPPGSLIGDTSREIESKPNDRSEKAPKKTTESNDSAKNRQYSSKKAKRANQQNGSQPSQNSEPVIGEKTSVETDTVVGRVYIDRLMMTLFPHKKSLNSNSQTDRSNNNSS